jgi:hypothetical protein
VSKTWGQEHEMMTGGLKWLIFASLTAGFAAAAQAEDVDVGKSEFQSSCASCQGTAGKGNGPVSEQLKVAPPDLTILAKKNNGVFPTNAVYEANMGQKQSPLTARVKCRFGRIDSTLSSIHLTLLIRLMTCLTRRGSCEKSSCEHASSL